jgi:hypothetical protein
MDLKHYVPISVGVFAAVILVARYFAVPVAPFAVILLVGETILGFQIEDQKVGRFVDDLVHALKPTRRAR